MNTATGKYVISKIDGKEYCRKNGQFFRHLKLHGHNYHTYYITFLDQKEFCPYCDKEKSFRPNQMIYCATCGHQLCVDRERSRVKLNFTKEKEQQRIKKFQQTMFQKTEEEWEEIKQKKIQASDYQQAKENRRITCLERYGDETYNNASQISKTKLEWDENRKQLFLTRLKHSLGEKWLSDFHPKEMYKDRRKLLEERGDIVPWEQLTEWQQYSKGVRNISNRNYRKYKDIINPNGLKRSRGHYELDHVIPVFWGFLNNIPEQLIASVENLQMLHWKENRTKSKKYEPASST